MPRMGDPADREAPRHRMEVHAPDLAGPGASDRNASVYAAHGIRRLHGGRRPPTPARSSTLRRAIRTPRSPLRLAPARGRSATARIASMAPCRRTVNSTRASIGGGAPGDCFTSFVRTSRTGPTAARVRSIGKRASASAALSRTASAPAASTSSSSPSSRWSRPRLAHTAGSLGVSRVSRVKESTAPARRPTFPSAHATLNARRGRSGSMRYARVKASSAPGHWTACTPSSAHLGVREEFLLHVPERACTVGDELDLPELPGAVATAIRFCLESHQQGAVGRGTS